MQLILFVGIQATGKSSFFKKQFFNSHVRISMDLLNTRNKEKQFIETCFKTQQRFVVDNTNPTAAERKRYLDWAKKHKYEVIGYYFESKIEASLERNAQRKGKARIPDIGVRATYKKLELPSMEEGFDALYFVQLEDQQFKISPWENEV